MISPIPFSQFEVFFHLLFHHCMDKVVDIISDILQNSELQSATIKRERDVILREQQEVDNRYEGVIFDHPVA
jgi:processing peptidase subunit beta